MKKTENLNLYGLNIYYDKKGQNIYKSPFKNIGYIIKPNQRESFHRLKSRFIIPVLFVIILHLFFDINIIIACLIALVAFGLMQYRFYKLLNNSTIISNFNPDNYQKSLAPKHQDLKVQKIRALSYLLLTVLLIVNAFIAEKDIYRSISSGLAIYALFNALKTAYIIKKNKGL